MCAQQRAWKGNSVMFAIHTDNIDIQKRLASSIHQPRGLPAGKHEMQFPAKQPAQQVMA